MNAKSISIEGYSTDEILNFSDEEIRAFIFINEPLVFKIGTAEILGEFKIKNENLVVELAQIEGGGEGVLPLLFILTKKYAQKQNLKKVEWIVHAINCAKPNPKLRPLLERKGFKIENVEGIGEVYYNSYDV